MGTRSHTPHPHDPLPIRALTYGYRRRAVRFPGCIPSPVRPRPRGNVRRRRARGLSGARARGHAAFSVAYRPRSGVAGRRRASPHRAVSIGRGARPHVRHRRPARDRSERTSMRSCKTSGFAWRALRRQPAMSAIIVLTLGLGIGAVTTIFTALDSIVLRPAAVFRARAPGGALAREQGSTTAGNGLGRGLGGLAPNELLHPTPPSRTSPEPAVGRPPSRESISPRASPVRWSATKCWPHSALDHCSGGISPPRTIRQARPQS